MKPWLGVIALPLLALAAPLLALADMPVGRGATGDVQYDQAVARTVRAIIEYTRWPKRADPVLVCVAGPVRHAAQLGALRLADGRRLERRNIAPSSVGITGCEVLYIGDLPIAQQRELTFLSRGRAVLTLAEADESNASEAMFVLAFQARSLSFRLNVDAVSRSGLRVDPRVLRVARGGGQ